MSKRPEHEFPTIRDLGQVMDELIERGLGDHLTDRPIDPPEGTRFVGEAWLRSWNDGPRGKTATWLLAADDCPGDVHPLRGLEGKRFRLYAIELADDEQPAADPKPARSYWGDKRPSQQAGIRCGDLRFQRWLYERDYSGGQGSYDDEGSARRVREFCGVTSRAELDTNDAAAERWRRLDTDFRIAVGELPEVR